MVKGVLPSGKLIFRIKEVSDIVGVPAHVLRFWETEFSWISPERDAAGRRRYTRRNIEDLLVVKKMLHEDRYTIPGARKVLSRARHEGRINDYRKPTRDVLKKYDDRIMLQSVKKELQKLLDMLR
jgi:DNA-binding transcriptional MerR regulator